MSKKEPLLLLCSTQKRYVPGIPPGFSAVVQSAAFGTSEASETDTHMSLSDSVIKQPLDMDSTLGILGKLGKLRNVSHVSQVARPFSQDAWPFSQGRIF